jgi:heme/copper-type cytochrome/quinol oxidase subunit 4
LNPPFLNPLLQLGSIDIDGALVDVALDHTDEGAANFIGHAFQFDFLLKLTLL